MMTLPDIDGYTSSRPSLLDEWTGPTDLALLPSKEMARIERHPVDWLTIEYTPNLPDVYGGVSTLLVSPGAQSTVLSVPEWSGRSLGGYGTSEDGEELGLQENYGDELLEFFCGVQNSHPLRPPMVELSLPFAWFWDATRVGNDWYYLDGAGAEHHLIRTTPDAGGALRVEVRAPEFRRYLGQRGLKAIVQHEHILWADTAKFDEQHHKHESLWCVFVWHARHDYPLGSKNAHGRLLGKQVIDGVTGGPAPHWLEPLPNEYPTLIYGVDGETGEDRVHTCEPDKLSNYFGKNPDAPNYLTPVHFDPKILNRYLDEPERFAVSKTRISATVGWSISIGRTSTGDVEAYLGDVGRDLPWQEHAHWKSHNVRPRGRMSEDRFRRDFLGQWAGEVEPLDQLRIAYARANSASVATFGEALFKPLSGEDAVSFERLQPPTLKSDRALIAPILTMSKTLIDGIDTGMLKNHFATTEVKSLALLGEVISAAGGDPTRLQPLRALNRLRSGGGVAHLAGASRRGLLKELQLDNMAPAEIIEHLATRIAEFLDYFVSAVLEPLAVSEE